LFAKVEIFATAAKYKGDVLYLINPVIVYKDYVIQAKEGIVKNKKTVILKGNVVVFYKNISILANKATLYSKKNIDIKDVFLIDRYNEIWFKSPEIMLKNNVISLRNLMFSSCCVEKPDWYLFAKRGVYNKKTKYMRLYHVVLYVYDTPVFYFPFFFNSLNKKRHSGLLRPYVGYSAKEGFLYSQPIYIVLGPHADFEITPTIRTKRGRGIYNTFRFVTSPYDYGEIKFGEFVDFDKYYLQNNLAHKKHYGYEIYYTRDKVFSNDKLYAKIKYANDVDYFYLNPYNYTFNTSYLVDKLITSKVNYIKPLNRDYFLGVYAKYFIDTTKISNDDTIQILPQINIHKFETKNTILNSFDLNVYNYYSKPKKYYQVDFNLPLSIDKRFFDDFLNVKLSETFNYVSANYYNSQTRPQYFYELYNSLKFYTSLAKKNSFLHIINPSIEFNFKQLSKVSQESDLLNYTDVVNSVSLNLFQIFEKGDFYLDHTLRQNSDIDFKKKGSLENIINLKKGSISLSDTNKYSWDLKSITYNSFSLSFPVKTFNFKISHLYSKEDSNNTIQTYTLRVEKNVNQNKKYYFEYNYDIENRYVQYFLLGVQLNKRCWQYNLSIQKNRIPVLTDSGISYNNNYILSLNINFYPIGGLKQTIQIK
jgi:LPS-assembly protein